MRCLSARSGHTPGSPARPVRRKPPAPWAGSVMANNPVPLLVPCHRVVRNDGRTGQYAFGAGKKSGCSKVRGPRRGHRRLTLPRDADHWELLPRHLPQRQEDKARKPPALPLGRCGWRGALSGLQGVPSGGARVDGAIRSRTPERSWISLHRGKAPIFPSKHRSVEGVRGHNRVNRRPPWRRLLRLRVPSRRSTASLSSLPFAYLTQNIDLFGKHFGVEGYGVAPCYSLPSAKRSVASAAASDIWSSRRGSRLPRSSQAWW
jgi:6-O-methylguanine DNA methyltransferase, DNA binding domain